MEVQLVQQSAEGCDPNEFAGRQKELELIAGKLQSARHPGPDHRLLVEFFGMVGIGKSSLLRYLATLWNARSEPATRSALINFAQFNQPGQWPDLLTGLADQLGISPPGEQGASALVSQLGGLSEVLLLLFDTSEKSSELLELLEDQLVFPLLRTGRVVFVFAGRRWLRWKRFEVRRRVDAIELGPFNQEHTSEQLEKLGIDKTLAGPVYPYSFGHPGATRVIIDAFQRNGLPVTVDALNEHQDIIHKAVYRQFIQGRLFKGWQQDLRLFLELTCIPRRFDVTPLKAFAGRFYPDKGYDAQPGGYYLDMIRDMQDTTLVQWSSDWGGYILLPVLRWIMAKNLSMRDPDRFKAWHKEAAAQYEEWINLYPRNAVGFLIEWAFHRAWVCRAQGQTDQEIGEMVAQEMRTRWEEIKNKPEAQWDLPEMTEMLKSRVQDKEIATFFPELYQKMTDWGAQLEL